MKIEVSEVDKLEPAVDSHDEEKEGHNGFDDERLEVKEDERGEDEQRA